MAAEETKSPPAPEASASWKPFAFGLLAGLFISAGVLLATDEATKAGWARTLLGWAGSAVAAILTSAFTYVFWNRHLRKREREADKVIARNVAQIVDLLDGRIEGGKEIEGDEPFSWLKAFEASEKGKRRSVSAAELENLLFELRGVPAFLRAAIADLASAREFIAASLALLGTCTPSAANSIPELVDDLDFNLRELTRVLERADRGYDELERIECYSGDRKALQAEIEEVLERVADGVGVLCEDVAEITKEFIEGPLRDCLGGTWPSHMVEAFEQTKKDLAELGEEE